VWLAFLGLLSAYPLPTYAVFSLSYCPLLHSLPTTPPSPAPPPVPVVEEHTLTLSCTQARLAAESHAVVSEAQKMRETGAMPKKHWALCVYACLSSISNAYVPLPPLFPGSPLPPPCFPAPPPLPYPSAPLLPLFLTSHLREFLSTTLECMLMTPAGFNFLSHGSQDLYPTHRQKTKASTRTRRTIIGNWVRGVFLSAFFHCYAPSLSTPFPTHTLLHRVNDGASLPLPLHVVPHSLAPPPFVLSRRSRPPHGAICLSGLSRARLCPVCAAYLQFLI
jgi:hypothetical protein